MNTKHTPLDRLAPNRDNPRKITDENFKRLVTSLLAFPKMLELRPVIIDAQMNILGGNMRTLALQHIARMDDTATREHLAAATHLTEAERDRLALYWQNWRKRPTAPTLDASELTEQQRREFIIKDNSAFGHWDTERLLAEWQDLPLTDWGLAEWNTAPTTEEATESHTKDAQAHETETDEQQDTEEENEPQSEENRTLSLTDQFIIPPFTVLDTRTGYWQARKRLWRERIGATNGETREGITFSPEMCYPQLYVKFGEIRKTLPEKMNFTQYLDTLPDEVLEAERKKNLAAGVSLFDPVLSEILCQCFTPHAHSNICDPFAGDTQKGMVFAMLGHRFTGIELRAEQVEANRRNLEGRDLDCTYICDDGRNIRKHIEAATQDLLFSCPPYFDLEQYSDMDTDASNQRTYNAFLQILAEGFRGGWECLKNNRFAILVVGDVRNHLTTGYYDFPSDLVRIFKTFGATLINRFVLVEQIGSSCLRARNNFQRRKATKCHQDVLVFYKGNPENITNHFRPIDLSDSTLADLERQLDRWRPKDD